jgi:hypothetical protein
MSSENLLKQVEQFQATYYSKNSRNFFFKSKQKMDCASQVSQEFDIHQLVEKTVYLVPNSNRVYFDYTIFKLYGNPDNYQLVVNYALSVFTHCIATYGGFELHVNLNSFTMTAAERYRVAIELFCNECMKSQTRYASMLTKMYIYNSPNMIEHVTGLFGNSIDPLIRERLFIYNKEETGSKIEELFSV